MPSAHMPNPTRLSAAARASAGRVATSCKAPYMPARTFTLFLLSARHLHLNTAARFNTAQIYPIQCTIACRTGSTYAHWFPYDFYKFAGQAFPAASAQKCKAKGSLLLCGFQCLNYSCAGFQLSNAKKAAAGATERLQSLRTQSHACIMQEQAIQERILKADTTVKCHACTRRLTQVAAKVV